MFLATRKLIGSECLPYLCEAYFVFRAHYLLSRLLEEVVDEVLESLFGFGYFLSTQCRVGFSALQSFNDAVAYVHLIVEILALKEEELEIEFCCKVGK